MSGVASPTFRHRNVDLAAFLLLALMASAAFWVGIRPVFHAEERERRLVHELRSSAEQLAAAQEEHAQLKATMEATRLRLERSAVELHSAQELARRQEELTFAMVRGGLEIEQVVVGGAVRGDLLDTIPIHVTGSGSFPQIVSVMHDLRAAFPDMAVTSFQMTGGLSGGVPSEKAEARVRFMLDVAWYTARTEGGES